MNDAPTETGTAARPSSPDARAWCARVVWEGGAPADRVVPVGAGLAVGRGTGGDGLRLADARVSRRHASLVARAAGVHVEDAGSHNGTSVDGARVAAAVAADGAVVRVGDSLLVVRHAPLHPDDAVVRELRGAAPAMCATRARLASAAPSRVPLLLRGESGTGKTVAARAVHRLSGRPGRLVVVNCAAIADSLADSALFGHVAGAFTGAVRAAEGFFAASDGGTLFLDEVAELAPTVQARLLVALDEGVITPVGSAQPRALDLRVVAATHQDLAARVGDGRFRGDLYARLAAFEVTLPALRDRREDVLPLLRAHLDADGPPLSTDLAEALVLLPWRFNVRELLGLAEELRLRGAGRDRLDVELLGDRRPVVAEPASVDGPPDRDALVDLLTAHRGVISAVARATDRSTKQVYRWLRAHDLDPDDFRG